MISTILYEQLQTDLQILIIEKLVFGCILKTLLSEPILSFLKHFWGIFKIFNTNNRFNPICSRSVLKLGLQNRRNACFYKKSKIAKKQANSYRNEAESSKLIGTAKWVNLTTFFVYFKSVLTKNTKKHQKCHTK